MHIAHQLLSMQQASPPWAWITCWGLILPSTFSPSISTLVASSHHLAFPYTPVYFPVYSPMLPKLIAIARAVSLNLLKLSEDVNI